MPVELRKRKGQATEPPPAPPAKKKGAVAVAVEKVKKVVAPKAETTNGTAATTSASKTGKVAVGDTITLEGFGGEVETNDGDKTTLKKLVEESKGGVVLFTYPKASTPGCTTQVCLFRDSYAPLTATGFSIFGLSKDSPKSNTTFKTKQKLPYTLLCDPKATLIQAIGMNKSGGATRGVFVVDKEGKVLAAEPGGPAATLEVVKKLIGTEGVPATVEDIKDDTNGVDGPKKEDVVQAETAAEVADTAEKLDSNTEPVAA